MNALNGWRLPTYVRMKKMSVTKSFCKSGRNIDVFMKMRLYKLAKIYGAGNFLQHSIRKKKAPNYSLITYSVFPSGAPHSTKDPLLDRVPSRTPLGNQVPFLSM